MYQAYYGLDADPFRLTPDRTFRFAHRGYARARARLELAFQQGMGLIVLTGAPGSGKTLLLAEILARQSGEGTRGVQVDATQLEGDELVCAVAERFVPDGQPTGGGRALQRLWQILERQRERDQRFVLAIDAVRERALESVTRIAALAGLRASSQYPLLQVLVAGPPGLAGRLGEGAVVCELGGMEEHETGMYIEHRLWCAGWQGDPRFSPGAIRAIHELAQGIPRNINLICGRVLLNGAGEGKHEFDEDDALKVAADLVEETLLDPECLARRPKVLQPSPAKQKSPPESPAPPLETSSREADNREIRPEPGESRIPPRRNAQAYIARSLAVTPAGSHGRRSRARTSILRYAAAGALLSVVLYVILYQPGVVPIPGWPLANSSTDPAVNAQRVPIAPWPGMRDTAQNNGGLRVVGIPARPRTAIPQPVERGKGAESEKPASLVPLQTQRSAVGNAPKKATAEGAAGRADAARAAGPLRAAGKKAGARSATVRQAIIGYRVTRVTDYRVGGRDCRQYTLEGNSSGRQLRFYGTACRQPDGSWGRVEYPAAFFRTVMP